MKRNPREEPDFGAEKKTLSNLSEARTLRQQEPSVEADDGTDQPKAAKPNFLGADGPSSVGVPTDAAPTQTSKLPALDVGTHVEIERAADPLPSRENGDFSGTGELSERRLDFRSATNVAHMSRPGQPHAQIATVLEQLAIRHRDGEVTVQLFPEELGSVVLKFSGTEAGMVVSVVSERADTDELLRRNASQLLEDLARSGFADVDLSFGSADGEQPGWAFEREEKEGFVSQADPVAVLTSRERMIAPMAMSGSSGLDIRV
ncbi:MAG: flagellar hook-length control protein FliK [Pseudomonadota bacterium]